MKSSDAECRERSQILAQCLYNTMQCLYNVMQYGCTEDKTLHNIVTPRELGTEEPVELVEPVEPG